MAAFDGFGGLSQGDELVIVDFGLKGNVCRIYLGRPGVKPWGDDWNDAPYEHNAGVVYDEFVEGHVDVAFPFDAIVAEPSLGEWNSSYSKQDMLRRRVPCLAILRVDDRYDRWRFEDSFARVVAHGSAHKLFFGDKVVVGDASWLPTFATVLGWSKGMG